MNTEKLMVAFNAFIHVCGILVIVIAFISAVPGLIREYILQGKLEQKLTKHEKWSSLFSTVFGKLTPPCNTSIVQVSMGIMLFEVQR